MKQEKNQRLQFDFSPQVVEALDRLVKATNATSRAELLRKALALYDAVVDCRDTGAKVIIRYRSESGIDIERELTFI